MTPLIYASLPQLMALYTEPGRFYHNIDHIKGCLALAQKYELGGFTLPPRLYEAIWFHDAVYNLAGHTGYSEKESADLYVQAARTVGEVPNYQVIEMIMATTKHLIDVSDKQQFENADAVHLMLDIDLHSLGTKHAWSNAKKIAREYHYAGATKVEYVEGRTKFINAMLEKPLLFYTQWFKERYENFARENLESELKHLHKIVKEVWANSPRPFTVEVTQYEH